MALENVIGSCRIGVSGKPSSDFRVADFPAHHARILRHPRFHRISSVREERRRAFQALGYTDETWENLSYRRGGLPTFDEALEEQLQDVFAATLLVALTGLREMLTSAESCALVDASRLPYIGEFQQLFPFFGNLASAWLRRADDPRYSGNDDALASELVEQALVPSPLPWTRTEEENRLAVAVGSYRELLATTWRNDGRELGLPQDPAPAMGWLSWFGIAADALSARLRSLRPEGSADTPLVTAALWPPVSVPGTDDPRFGNAALLYEAFEGAPISDTPDWRTGDAIGRFRRACAHPRFPHEVGPVIEHMHALIAAAAEDDRLLGDVLGPVKVFPGIDPLDAVADLAAQLSADSLGPGHPSLAELPLNGWEIRFRFPLLADFGKRRPEPTGPWSIETLAAAHEPCRLGLPPLIGEIAELLALLPGQDDVNRAMAHLGADGTGWKPVLERIVAELTEHIRAHEKGCG